MLEIHGLRNISIGISLILFLLFGLHAGFFRFSGLPLNQVFDVVDNMVPEQEVNTESCPNTESRTIDYLVEAVDAH